MRRRSIDWVAVLILVAILVPLSRSASLKAQEQSAFDGWQAYSDPTHGYAVSYPPGWGVQTAFENARGEPYIIRRRVTFHGPQGARIEIDVWARDASTPIDRWFQEVEGITSTVEIHAVVSGQEAFVLVQPGDCGVPPVFSTYVPFGDRVFKIHHQYAGDQRSLDAYDGILRSFSLEGVDRQTQSQTTLPDFLSMLPSTCGTNVCPSTCSGGCTFAPVDQGCCGYHPIPWWQCSRECIGAEIGEFNGNCVWWGAYTRRDVGELASGNAENWAISVRNTGQLPVDTTPKVGDIVVHPGSSYNHVAYVVWVSSDGTSYKMSDMGWCADCGPSPDETKLRSVDANDEFIHCKGDPSIPTIDWQFADCPFGWTPSMGFSASELDGSAWILNPADDPYLLSPILSVSASEYYSITISMANNAGDTVGRIAFTTSSSPGFDEDKAVSFTTSNDGTWREVVVDMSDNPQWEGTITRIRIDPVEAGNSDGSFDDVGIARIRFVNLSPPPAYSIYLPLVLRNHAPGPVNRPPHTPSEPLPADGATDQAVSLTLAWTGGDPDGDVVTYDVYLDPGDGTSQTPVCEDVIQPTCDPGLLLGGTQYSWQVVSSDEHGAITAGPVWSFFTAPPACVEAIANGGFETDSDWELPSTAYPASYTTADAHGGDRSMRVGIVDPGDNVYSYSSARQLVSIPVGAESATLRYWLHAISGEAAALAGLSYPLASPQSATSCEDAQYVLVLNQNNVRIATLLWQLRDDPEWTYHEADLSDYAGRTIKLQFGVCNDGQGGVTALYVDDVSLEVCSP